MNLFRYIDALDRIEEARRGPRGLLDDEWFDTYANPGGILPSVGQGGAVLFAPGHDPVNDWYKARLRQALRETFARLRGQASMPPMPGWPAGPTDPAFAGMGGEFPNGDPWRYALRPVPLPKAQTNRPDSPLTSANGEPPEDRRPDYDYPWNEPDASNTGPVESTNVPPTPESLRKAPGSNAGAGFEFGAPHESLTRSFDERNVERAEAKMRAYVRRFREAGYHTAADHLERYLDRVSGTMLIDRDQARSFAPIQSAEEKNDQRFERSFLSDTEVGHAKKLRGLKDGESVEISDDFAADHGPFAFAGQVLDPSTRDYALAFGSLGVKSYGNFTATRRGDEIHIQGIVDHKIKDPYDFNPGGPYSAEPNLLERHGKAKPFERRGLWSRRVNGTIRLEGGELRDPQFTWEDIDR
jgi:hypothetical protein